MNGCWPRLASWPMSCPGLWSAAHRFIEAGDGLVWELTGQEMGRPRVRGELIKRSINQGIGYPARCRAGSLEKSPNPSRLESRRDRSHRRVGVSEQGTRGKPTVADRGLIDSHVVMPAASGSVRRPGRSSGPYSGTSAVSLLLDYQQRPRPAPAN